VIAGAATMVLLATAPAPAQVRGQGIAVAVDTGIAACERWLLEPASWSDDIASFGRAQGLQPQASVPSVALPPPSMRVALHHWRVPLGEGGVYVTASHRLPACHLSGGGPFDMQPAIVALRRSPGFTRRWKRTGGGREGDMVSERFVSTVDPGLSMTLSHAAAAGGRTDRVQFLATASYQIRK
jgi:hypothetical protein